MDILFLRQLPSHGIKLAYFYEPQLKTVSILLSPVIYETIYLPFFKLLGAHPCKTHTHSEKSTTIIKSNQEITLKYIFTSDFKNIGKIGYVDKIFIIKNENVTYVQPNNIKKINKVLVNLY